MSWSARARRARPIRSLLEKARSIGPRHMDTQIRRIRAHEWGALRSFRLRALADSPTAFGSTLAKEQAYSEEVWRERTFGASTGCDRAAFVAEREGGWIGAVTGLANQFATASGVPLLVAMFVAASVRRQGIGVALVDALTSWARDCGASQISLWVISNNDAGVALYQRMRLPVHRRSKPRTHVSRRSEPGSCRSIIASACLTLGPAGGLGRVGSTISPCRFSARACPM